MTDEQLAAVNSRLLAPSTVDISAFRMMGIAVVSRLAARYRIGVELRRGAESGTVANVSLPSSILLLPRYRGRDTMLGRPRGALGIEWSRGSTDLPHRLPSSANGSTADLQAGLAAAKRTLSAPATQPVPAPAGASQAGWASQADRYATVAADALGHATAAPAAPAPVTETVELPIFQETEALWFASRGRSAMDGWEPLLPPEPAAPRPQPSPVASQMPSAGRPVPPPRQPVPAGATADEAWRTRADAGWRAASAASAPVTAGTTTHGLAKRVPAANLVPGGVEVAPVQRSRRSPDDVRGVLSAYHRGVQRGRGGDGDGASTVPGSDQAPNG
jgi:hypothetical protein